MTTMTPVRRRVKLAHRNASGAVYRTRKAAKPEALWRDLLAGAVFFTCICTGLVAIVCGGLMIFG
jgi:hypothetical protein